MKVLMTYVGDFWLEDVQAERLELALNSGKATMVNLNSSAIMLSQVQAVVTPEIYKTGAHTKKRNWSCQYGSGHGWEERCHCKQNLAVPSAAPKLSAENKLSPEQQAERERRTAAWIAWINKFKSDYQHPDFRDKVKLQNFIATYKISQ